MANKYDKTLDEYRENDAPFADFIEYGDNGITSIRWQSTPGGTVYEMIVNDDGSMETTTVSTNAGSPIGLLLALTYAS